VTHGTLKNRIISGANLLITGLLCSERKANYERAVRSNYSDDGEKLDFLEANGFQITPDAEYGRGLRRKMEFLD
jgi:hypothetical protein